MKMNSVIKKGVRVQKTFTLFTNRQKKREYVKNVKKLEEMLKRNADIGEISRTFPESFLNEYFEVK